MDLCYDRAPVRLRCLPPLLPRRRTPTFAKVYHVSSDVPPISEDEFLAALGANPVLHWPDFLRRYSSTLLECAASQFRCRETQMEAYVAVCLKLMANEYEALKRYVTKPPEARGRIGAWLATLIHNSCVDQVRIDRGRRTLPRSVERLGPLEQSIFRHVFWNREAYPATVEKLVGEGFPPLTEGRLSAIVDGIHAGLPRTTRWTVLLDALHDKSFRIDDLWDGSAHKLQLAGPDDLRPDVRHDRDLRDAWLRLALSQFTEQDRLVIYLRFEQGMRFRRIAQLAGFESERAANQRCRVLIERLRRELGLDNKKGSPPPDASTGGAR